MRAAGVATALVTAILGVGTAMAAPPPLPAPTYKTVSEYRMIAMDDGVRLGATITYPSKDGTAVAPGRFPVILSMTPYGRDGVCGCGDQQEYPSRGFVQAVVDVRGTGGSEGNLDGNYFSPREQRDGYDLVEWFGTQPWSTGKVGMTGGSYVGITQLLTAEQQPPHLAAIAPDEALSDLYRDAYTYDGVPDLFFDAQYIGVQGGPGIASGNIGGPGDSDSNADTNPADYPQQAQDTATAKAAQAQGTPILFDYLARPNDDAWYHDRSPWYRLDRIKVPVLIMDGWRDGAFTRGDLENYQALAARPDVETLLNVGPCTHKGCGPPFDTQSPPGIEDTQALEFAFMDRHLRGADVTTQAPVHYYVQPSGPYADAGRWPPEGTDFRRLYLHPGAGAAEPAGGSLQPGTLDAAAPKTEGSDSYFTNPAAGLSMSLNSYGTIAISPFAPTDQRLEEEQGLTWRTAPYAKAARLAGPLQLHLAASSSATDTDWDVRLSDVGTDGSESVITEGALRASHREIDPARSSTGAPYHLEEHPQPIVAGKTYDFDIAIIPTAYELAPGHSLQLRLTTDDVPTRLPGTFQFDRDNPTQSPFVPLDPATNTVNEGPVDPSWLLVPVQSS